MFSVCARFSFDFKLDSTVLRMIHENPLKTYEFQIRFGEQLLGTNELKDGLPAPTQICINTYKFTTTGSILNFNCNTYIHTNKSNNVAVTWPYCKKAYYMEVNIVESIDVEDMVKLVQHNNILCSMSLKTKEKTVEMLNVSDSDVVEPLSYNFSLLCPISKLKMKLPSRSINCRHIQCFDLRTFILLNKIKSNWTCPICKTSILMEELVVDSFFLDVINSSTLPENCSEIILSSNDKWEPYIEPKKETLENNQSESDDENSENNICPVDLEYTIDEKTIIPTTSDWIPYDPNPIFIDLTTTTDNQA